MKKDDKLLEYSSELIEVGEERRKWNIVKYWTKEKLKSYWYLFIVLLGLLIWVIDNKSINVTHGFRLLLKSWGI